MSRLGATDDWREAASPERGAPSADRGGPRPERGRTRPTRIRGFAEPFGGSIVDGLGAGGVSLGDSSTQRLVF